MKPILKWQYEQLVKELLLLQGHVSDPSCPCKSSGEMCFRKHLLTIEALAQESAPIAESNEEKDGLEQLAGEAKELREQEERNLCGQKAAFPQDPADWARKWRKRFESLACELIGSGAKKMKAPEELLRLPEVPIRAIQGEAGQQTQHHSKPRRATDNPVALSPEESAIPGFGKRLERCLRKLQPRQEAGEIGSAVAVCRASLRESENLPIGAKGGNPGAPAPELRV